MSVQEVAVLFQTNRVNARLPLAAEAVILSLFVDAEMANTPGFTSFIHPVNPDYIV